MKNCEGCGKELDAPESVGAVVCRGCLDAIEVELELELAKGLVEYRCEACNRQRPEWIEGSRCACGSRTVLLVDRKPNAN